MKRGQRLVSVLVPVPVEEAFTYVLPPGVEAEVGVRVEVPFGRRRVTGFVVGEGAALPEGMEAKAVGRVLDEAPVFTPDLVETTRRLARRYGAPWYRTMEAAVPVGFKMRGGARAAPKRVRALRLAVPAEEARRALSAGTAAGPAGGTARRAASDAVRTAVEVLREFPLVHTAASLGRLVGAPSAAAALRKRGLVEEVAVEVPRDPLRDHPVLPDTPPALTPEQAAALETVRRAMAAARVRGGPGGAPSTVLLRGVTGSGKTEVYLRAIQEALGAGGGAIVLVPEISLTPQTVDRFRARLGDEAVAVLHSALSEGERADEWRRLARGAARLAVGPRSAVFAPVRDLRLIVVDEEHETSYKQAETPRYHAREAALARAAAAGAAVVLGSATPSIEAEAAARAGAFALSVLSERVDGRPLPPVEVADMREEMAAGNDSIFSRRLVELLGETLDRREQAILFLNRRGTASFLLCRGCGRTVRCDRCDASMTLHARAGNLRCHFCEARRDLPDACPGCGADAVRPYGLGTERVEAEARLAFPAARVVRMDADTTARRGAHREILGAFGRGEADVLVGTQMIGKGLDLPRVTLVGVVAAETSLGLPDFRAGERTFDLVVQVAGRAGRSAAGGRVVVQTYRPDHAVIRAAAAHDYAAFFEREVAIRRASDLPPFVSFTRVIVRAPTSEGAREAAERAAEAAAAAGEVIGPSPAPVERVRGAWRWAFLVRRPAGDAEAGAAVAAALRGVRLPTGVRLAIDVDPLDVL